jgi:hypothetical protein
VKRRLLLICMLVAALALPASAGAAIPGANVRHVFTIVLENESESTTFGPGSPAPYLSTTLPSEGAFVPNYYGVGHFSNDNYIAMISGQPPNISNEEDCPTFSDFSAAATDAYGAQEGAGCVYPANIQTVANQLQSAGLTWRDYNQDMGAVPSRDGGTTCAHPPVGAPDPTEAGSAADEYAARHNPFVYFHSIIDNAASCQSHVVNLNALAGDLASARTTPNYAFITPNLCADGHNATCATPGEPGGYAGIQAFLERYVPMITGSAAFKQNGLLIITFDEAAASDASGCCGEIAGPSSGSLLGTSGTGGGKVGAVLLSPCIKPGTVTQTAYNHYTMLASVETIFAVAKLGYAALPGGTTFGSDIFDRPCGLPPVVKVKTAVKRTTITVSWSATDNGGPGVAYYTVQVNAGRGFKTLLASTRKRSAKYKGKHHKSYQFRVRAVDSAGISSAYVSSRKVKLK